MRKLLCLLLLTACSGTSNPKQCLRLNFHSEPASLDPRFVRDIPTMTTSKMLYDGLMRMSDQGPELSLAKRIKQEGNRYTFFLRESLWSDGQRVTAFDFEYAWKSLLHPHFPAEFAYHLFMIKGAEAAKRGEISVQDVAIWAEDALTLVVELEQEHPHFLELVSQPICYPVPHMGGEATNGPFELVHFEHASELMVKKSSNYWDKEAVHLQQIVVSFIEDEHTELNMYEIGELDWAGSPNSSIPPEALPTLKERPDLHISPIAGTFCYKFNIESAPFDNAKMRKAFALAMNRKTLVDHILQANQQIARGLIPPCMGQDFGITFLEREEGNPALALQLFEEALAEEGLTRETLPPITLSFSRSEKTQKTAQAVQQQWNKLFDVKVNLQSFEWNIFIDKLAKRDYQVAGKGIVSDLLDPKSFLDHYKERNDSNNETGWESDTYQALLEEADQSMNNREHYLRRAEQILLSDMPLVPLYHSTACYLKSESLHEVYLSELCDLDFKYAFIK
ncbi:MAG: Oligopeptide-binding protein OppA [Chlamydiales bacterium]|nr:Oligopeptide-binding protein OppA [Chlamydiales bacterium]MCH9635159.1 Oligopeptide-binding protein OppA [Chlamydiales bacterium]MCH9704455.1 peptide ABC transporter substrate-binding protein [Chlamydiota bacterium]